MLPNRRSAHRQTSSTIWVLALLFIFALTLQACSGSIDLETGHLPISSEAVNADLSDNFAAYFSDPENPVSSSYRGGPDEALADAIRDARVSVDMAIHFLDLWSIRDALIDAHRRGVTVRLVTESDYIDVPEIQELRAAGIPVLGDRREGRMHNKFVVIDRQEVWTGSLNLFIGT
jgi:phosphatidylserine/phosphatidylglycerophosphate/cardiolipin synthase-like enzyme